MRRMSFVGMGLAGAIALTGCVSSTGKDKAASAEKPACEASASCAPRQQPCRRIHPDSCNWKQLFELDLSNALFETGVWFINDKGDLTANKDSAIWSAKEYQNFILDFEYMLDPGANSGCLIYCSNMQNWIPGTVEIQLLDDNHAAWKKDAPHNKNGGLYGHLPPKVNNVKPAGEWNHMTVWAVGKRIKVAVNNEITVDTDLSQWKNAKKNPDGTDIPSWLSTPWAEIPARGHIGFQGRHGKSAPYFRFIRVKEL